MTSRLRTLTKFQSDDEVVNRLQDHLREVLNPVLGNVAAADVVTSKGDLTVGTGDGAVARLPVGSAGQLLVPDATQDVGLKWTSQEAWTAPTLLNSWVNFGGGYAPIAYMKDSQGFVHLRGGAKSGTINTNLFVLPAGYQPKASIQFPIVSNNAFGAVQIDSSGNVLPFVGSNVTLFIDGITFDTR